MQHISHIVGIVYNGLCEISRRRSQYIIPYFNAIDFKLIKSEAGDVYGSLFYRLRALKLLSKITTAETTVSCLIVAISKGVKTYPNCFLSNRRHNASSPAAHRTPGRLRIICPSLDTPVIFCIGF